MPRRKVIWLCSWYPGKTDPFNGDFIQRHARAAALYDDIYVIHVIGDSSGKTIRIEKSITSLSGVTEHIVYYPRTGTLWGRVRSHFEWLRLSRQAIRRYIIEFGKPDLVQVNVTMKAGILALWINKKYRIPFLVMEHWGIYNDVEVRNYGSKSSLFKKYTREIISKAVGFLTVSRFVGDGVNRLVSPKAYEIIPNVVDTNLFYFNEPSSRGFRFIHVSNMVPLKNVAGILQAFKKFQEKNTDAELVLVGGPNSKIRELVDHLNFEPGTLRFTGEVPYAEVAREMQESHAFILFSDIENSPCVIGEALCCGLPVITSAVGGVPELVDSQNSILVKAGEVSALENALGEMVVHYARFDRKKIAENASGKFSYGVIGKCFNAVYNRMLPG